MPIFKRLVKVLNLKVLTILCKDKRARENIKQLVHFKCDKDEEFFI